MTRGCDCGRLLCRCIVEGIEAEGLYVSGGPYRADVKLDPDPSNLAQITPDGLVARTPSRLLRTVGFLVTRPEPFTLDVADLPLPSFRLTFAGVVAFTTVVRDTTGAYDGTSTARTVRAGLWEFGAEFAVEDPNDEEGLGPSDEALHPFTLALLKDGDTVIAQDGPSYRSSVFRLHASCQMEMEADTAVQVVLGALASGEIVSAYAMFWGTWLGE